MGNLMTEKDTIGFFGQSCFLECHCLLSAFFILVEQGARACGAISSLLAQLHTELTYLALTPQAWQAHWSSGLLGHGECTMQMGEQGTRADSILRITPLLHHLIGFHLQNGSSR